MNNSSMNSECKSIFKNGSKPTRKAYTQVWIDMINHIESKNARHAAQTDEVEEKISNSMMEIPCSNKKEEQA